MTYTGPDTSPKPGKVQAIAIMTFISGIWNILYGIGFGIAFFIGAFGTFGVTLCCLPLGLVPIGVGIAEVICGAKLMGNPPRRFNVQTIAIFEIVNIISLAVPSLVIGILNLVFYNDPETHKYIDSLPL